MEESDRIKGRDDVRGKWRMGKRERERKRTTKGGNFIYAGRSDPRVRFCAVH